MNATETIFAVANFIINPEFTGFLLFIKILFLIFSILAIIFIIGVAFFRTDWFNWWILWDLKEFLSYRPYGIKMVTKEWAKIKKRAEGKAEGDYKMAIIEADDLLNWTLKNLQVGLETLEETLKKRINADTLPNIEKVKEAHKVRVDIVGDPDFKITSEKIGEVLGIYEEALRHLNVL